MDPCFQRNLPHGGSGSRSLGAPLQAQMAVHRAVCRRDIWAQGWVVQREEGHSSLHCREKEKGIQFWVDR